MTFKGIGREEQGTGKGTGRIYGQNSISGQKSCPFK